MNRYFLIIVWIGFMALFAYEMRFARPERVNRHWTLRYPWLLACIAFLPVIWMTANRGLIGDTQVYISTFENMPDSMNQIPVYMQTIEKDPGFYFFAALIRSIIGNKPVIYFFILAAIQGFILVTVYRKYSEDYFLSIFLFLASTDYISWMFNGVRQFMAVIVIFAASGLMIHKKVIPAIIVILIASLFHQSALLMIPIVLVAQGRAWNVRTVIFLAITVFAILYVDQFTDFLKNALSYTQYENVVRDYQTWSDNGTNPVRVLVYSLPAIISFFGRKQIQYENDALVNICVNMSITTAGLYLVSMATSGIFLGRLPIYCSLFNYILLPWELNHLFTRHSRAFIYVSMLLLYLVFYYYQGHITFQLF